MIDIPVEVKDSLREGAHRKNYRFLVLNDDGTTDFTIDNNNLVKESVSIDERMNSGDTLKFGLCEGASLEFQYFFIDRGVFDASLVYAVNNLVHYSGKTWRSKADNNSNHTPVEGAYWTEWATSSIVNKRLQAFIDVEYEHTAQDAPVYYDTISQQGVAHFTPYIFADAHTYQLKITEGDDKILLVKVLDTQGNIIDTCEVPQLSERTMEVTVPVGGRIEVEMPYDPEELLYVTIEITYTTSEPIKTLEWHTIPMGFFEIKNCSRQASTGIIKVTAYNKLMSDYLDVKANELIKNAFTTSSKITIAAYINSILLGDYRIPKSYASVGSPISPSSGGGQYPIVETATSIKGGLDLYLPQYGVNSPINSYHFGTGALKLGIIARIYYYYDSRNGDKVFLYFRKGSFEAFERAFYEFLKKVLDEAHIQDGNGNALSGQDILDELLTNHNFAAICGIRSLYLINEGSGNVISQRYKYYSTIQWEFEEQHGLPHKVDGIANDAFIKEPYGALIAMPYSYGVYQSNQLPRSAREISFDGENYGSFMVQQSFGDYKYYLNSALMVSPTQKVPIFTFNNEIYPLDERIVGKYWGGCLRTALGIEATEVDIDDLPDFTLRELQSAAYETECQYGQLDRETDLFSGVELNQSRPSPQETLYPENALADFKSTYSKLWADEGNVHKWKYLIITYKGLDQQGNEVDKTLQRTVNADGTDNYNMSDNWMFRNLVWAAEDVGAYADAMVAKMRDITWFPYEMWAAGLPYMETGDEIEILLGEETYTSYILQRQLKGIQNLQDTFINGTLDIF